MLEARGHFQAPAILTAREGARGVLDEGVGAFCIRSGRRDKVRRLCSYQESNPDFLVVQPGP
jgi:hypothetical protein